MSERIVITKVQINNTDLLLTGRMCDTRLIEARLDSLPEKNGLPSVHGSSGAHGNGEERMSSPYSILGSIYIGKVRRVIRNLNAAFVDIGTGTDGYLPLGHVTDPFMVKSCSPVKIVQDDELLVQVVRDAAGSKGPSLSTNLNFSGRYAVITTGNRRLGLSSKLDSAEREHFKSLLGGSLPGDCGLIVRTNAKNAGDDDIRAEIASLHDRMDDVLARAGTRTCFSCLYRPDPTYLSYLHGAYTANLDEIVTDIPSVYEELQAYCGNYRDLADIPLRLYEDEQLSLASLLNLSREIVRATAREVRLKSGGYLLIDPTEAMTVIDVNTGRSTFSSDREEHFMRINLEAAKETALQLRLRNISGIVIVDFIDLDSAGKKRQLLEELRHLTGSDPVPVTVHDITVLNLVEITRKRAEKSLSEQIKQLTMKNPLC